MLGSGNGVVPVEWLIEGGYEPKHRPRGLCRTNFVVYALHDNRRLHPSVDRGMADWCSTSEFHRIRVLFDLCVLLAGVFLAQ